MDSEKEFYELDIISVTDDNGNEILFELLKDMKQTRMFMLL